MPTRALRALVNKERLSAAPGVDRVVHDAEGFGLGVDLKLEPALTGAGRCAFQRLAQE